MQLTEMFYELSNLGFSLGIVQMSKDSFEITTTINCRDIFINIRIYHSKQFGKQFSLTLKMDKKLMINEFILDKSEFELFFNRAKSYIYRTEQIK